MSASPPTSFLFAGLLPVTLALASLSPPPRAPEPLAFLRDPHIAHGRLVFAYQGDIWLANADGSGARRITAHPATEFSPRFSPDGQSIAFSSNRMGNFDVYVVPMEGGEPRQLTFFPGPDEVEYWTPDGRGVVISTQRGTHPFGSPLYIVPLDGGLPSPMPMDFARAGMIRQDGGAVVFTRENKSETRKGYRGNNSADLYVQDLRTRKITQLTDLDLAAFREHVQDGHPMWGADGMIYFASERSGIYNIWRIAATGGQPAPVTTFTTAGVKWPSISPDGRTIVFTQDYQLYTLDVPNGTPTKVVVAAAVDPIDNRIELVRSENRADGFAPSPDGSQLAVDFRGEIFLVPAEAELGEKTPVTRSARRDRFAEYSPNGKMLAYISDQSGEEEVWVYDIAAGTRKQLSRHQSYKNQIVWAPDGSRIAFVGANRMFEVEVASARQREVAYNVAGGYNLSEYSPDGKWLVYTRSDEDQNLDVHLYDLTAGREHNVTRNPFRDSDGALTPDGRTLVFSSARDGGTNQLFTVSLARLTEDPDDPLVRARRRPAGERGDTVGGGGAGGGGRAAGGAGATPPTPLRLEPEGIERRAVQITTGSNAAGSYFISRDGRSVYFTSSDNDGPGLFQVGIDGRDRRRVAAGQFAGLTPSGDRRYVFYRQGGGGQGGGPGGGQGPGAAGADIFRMPISGQRPARVSFSLQVEVDRKAEWAQIFDESWRVMSYRFYDEKMHGKDWKAIRAHYEPLLAHVGGYDDVYELANHMIGELNTSHVGVSGPSGRPETPGYRTRYLGLELEPAEAGGRYRISHIYREGPADQEWLGLKVGDFVLAIDGQEVRAGDNYWRILNQAMNEYVPVRVATSAAGAGAREVRIKSLASIADLRYEDWVASRRRMVEEAGGGQIAYVHIRSMNQPSLARFRNEIDRYWNAKGIVVDIRYNGGGNIDQELLDILERKPYQFWNNRWGARTWGRRPRQAIAGPKVLLTNARSGSDSEVTPMGFRQLEIGRIVGNPTAAAVIATGSYQLINGGSIRTPGSLVVTYDPSKPNNYGVNLENYGVAPDVMVENTPEDELRGFDRELRAAIDEVLAMLKSGRWQYAATPKG